MDYRLAAATAYDECGSSMEVAGQLGCCESWVRRLIQGRRERGTLEPKPAAHRHSQRLYDEADEQAVRDLIKRRPDVTLAEVAEAIGKPLHPGNVCRMLARMKLPRKKSRRAPPSRTART
jgi:transposase